MTNLIAFEKESELTELTGLSRDELWKNGFNLDDWDIGFQSDKKIDYANLGWLENRMDNYCCGYSEVQYKGKYYYLVYHS